MDVTSLATELIDRIIGFCPPYTQYSLLKSQPFAPLAYKHYYKRVELGVHDNILNRYCGGTANDGGETKVPTPRGFPCAKSLLIFYKTHPLYIPDTLDVSRVQELESLYQMRPSFLQQFKCINYTSVDMELPSKFMELPFGIFVTSHSKNLPNNITKLDLAFCGFHVPLSVQELKLKGVDIDFDELEKMPCLKKLILVKYKGIMFIKHPTLLKIEFERHEGKADMSGCPKLVDLSIRVRSLGYTLGFKVKDTYRLPPKLIYLLLALVNYSPSLAKLFQFETLQFVSIHYESCKPASIRLPPNLTGLLIIGSYPKSKLSCNIPHKLVYLELRNVIKPAGIELPDSLVYLNLKNTYCCQHDYSHLKNLATFHPSVCKRRICHLNFKLPPLIGNYQYNGNYQSEYDDYFYFKDLKRVQASNISDTVLSSWVELLKSCADACYKIEIEGRSSLRNLNVDLRNYETPPVSPTRLELKNLTSLTITSNDCFELNLILPETLVYLSLSNVGLANQFINPPHLKFLKLFECKLISTPLLNDELEVLIFERLEAVKIDLLKKPPKVLKYMRLSENNTQYMFVDLTNTQLEEIYISSRLVIYSITPREYHQIKLPKSLQYFSYLVLEYELVIDFSECDHLCHFLISTVVSYSPDGTTSRELKEIKNAANKKIDSPI